MTDRTIGYDEMITAEHEQTGILRAFPSLEKIQLRWLETDHLKQRRKGCV